ncbi:hypothetical protein SCHPADRAFT_822939 [Schizopora paradoxa]|uniref:Uncharacterized protein n=1 Tax=Schizopora paradoxa TaxID=27342 RepID=A0A0H2RYF8_9AGAM|nr:hypothetical protein SCHPADRAFT_822939 [Schizopora paradoxa]
MLNRRELANGRRGHSPPLGLLAKVLSFIGKICVLAGTELELLADIVQDLYVSELRAYKAPPPVKDAHVGVVKAFTAPSTPSAPAAPTDLASELSAYDAAEPSTVEATVNLAEDDSGAGAQEFLAFLEKDLPKPEAHH